MKILVTGAAGFIGAALTQALLQRGDTVVGVDNLNDYYDVSLKKARLALCDAFSAFHFVKADIANRAAMRRLFSATQFDVVVNMAAQAGVRHSIEHPEKYVDANIVGFANILEGCRQQHVNHLVFASSSSVYGANTKLPFSEQHNVDHPIALYAASKKANELMAHSYANLYALPCTGLRFFTVYGPWGRPDMALFTFTHNILANKPLDVYNQGEMVRDFTYIDDIVDAVLRVIDQPPGPNPSWDSHNPDSASSHAPYHIYNVGNGQPVKLTDFIEVIEQSLGKTAQKNWLPLQPGDVISTHADVSALKRDFAFQPTTTVQAGVKQFIDWYLRYYQISP